MLFHKFWEKVSFLEQGFLLKIWNNLKLYIPVLKTVNDRI